jgi:hypothetical protein
MFASHSEGLDFDSLWWQAIKGLISVQTVFLFWRQEVEHFLLTYRHATAALKI